MTWLSRVNKQDNGCWHWTGAVDRHGYGKVYMGVGKETLAHRAIYCSLVKPIEPGKYLLHKCDNPICVNPEHMFEGTQADNLKDAQAKGRRLGQIPKKTPKAILDKIQEEKLNGKTQRQIAKQLDMSESYISQIINGIRRN